MEWLNEYHLGGIAIGICTFLIIGLFHPIVVKAEYYWGTRCWWIFLVLGIAGIIGTVLIKLFFPAKPFAIQLKGFYFFFRKPCSLYYDIR